MNRRDAGGAALSALGVVVFSTILYRIHPTFFWKDDFQLQFLPASREVARAWSSGSFPWLNAYSWFSGALAAEYQFGVFSMFRVLLDVLVWSMPASLNARAGILFIVHAAVAAGGAFLLARSYSIRGATAAMVAIVAALNGWILWWGTTWFVAVAAFAWIPWYWFSLRRIAAGTSRWAWLGAALACYLVLTAGSPYVALMALAIAVLNVASAMRSTSRRAAFVMTGASFLGLLLAAPAVLMLMELFPSGARMVGAQTAQGMWTVPPAGLFGLVVPAFTTTWRVFLERAPHPGVELAGAFVPLAALAAAAFAGPRDALRRLRPELILGGVLLVLMMLPSPAPLRWSFHWLPMFHLILALIGASALEEVRRPWRWGIALAAGTTAAALVSGRDVVTTAVHAGVLVVLCGAWALLSQARVVAVLPAAITLLAIAGTFLTFSRRGDVPVFGNAGVLLERRSFDTTRRYLSMMDAQDLFGVGSEVEPPRAANIETRPGNTPALAELEFINGYSPIGPEGLATVLGLELHGTMPRDRAEQILRFETGRNQLLHHLGVDGLVVPASLAMRERVLLARNGWVPVARIGTALLLHRRDRDARLVFMSALAVKAADERSAYLAIGARTTTQLPVVLLTPGARGLERYGQRAIDRIEQRRALTSFRVRGTGPRALVVFRRPWLPGLRATLDGQELTVLRADMLMPAIELEPNAQGEVRLFYRPRSAVMGAALATVALLVLAALSIRILLNGRSTEDRDLR